MERTEYHGEGHVTRARIVATPGQEEEFKAAAEEYRAAEEALKAAYRIVSEAKDRKRRATDKVAEFASVYIPEVTQ